MTETVDYVDITPHELAPTAGKRKPSAIMFQDTQWNIINNNPGKLTKEGIERRISLWKRSQNKYVLALYQTMLYRCKNIAQSGITVEGNIIYSRFPDESARWIESDTERLSREKVSVKPKFNKK